MSPPADRPTPPIGVVIATYNRAACLMQCLRHLESQTWKDFEVILVVDGSTDSTMEETERYRPACPFPLRVLYQPNSGPATARNLAIAQLRAPICILIGDDIFATPEFVGQHLAFHRSHPELEAVAVGYTRWAQEGQHVTPFMRWLDRDGVQFAYGDLEAGTAPSWKHFYTSNLSLKTAYLVENPFHEGFRSYGLEDVELGYRLAMQRHLAMFFLPEAVADHLHPTDFRRACRRALDVGSATHFLGKLWPEHRIPSARGVKRLTLAVLTEPRVILPALTWFTDQLTAVWCPNPLILRVLLLYNRIGYERAAAADRDVPGGS